MKIDKDSSLKSSALLLEYFKIDTIWTQFNTLKGERLKIDPKELEG